MLAARTSSLFVLAATTAFAVPPPEQTEFFEKSIRPILTSECYECHGAKKQKGDLRLDFRDGWKKGGESGQVIIPGDPAKSLLIKSIRHDDADLAMPKKRPKLSDAVIADFEKWIALGAPDPRDEPPKADANVPWEQLLADRKTWWSLQPIQKPQPPPAGNAAWSTHEADRFLLAKMEGRGLMPAGDADPRTVIRRLTFALTGLPPSAGEVEDFVRECSEGPSFVIRHPALSALADRLLASPRFGEHWARHWMDLVRYAETHGSEGDPEIPNAWRYRDYLVRAFNADVPLDQIIREHLAGDLIENPRWNRDEHFNESILGIAHLRLVEHGFQPVDTRDEQVKVLDSQIDVAMKAFQALTVSCARCHDHKFDAIGQRDYYALAGIFESSRPAMVTIDTPELLEKNKVELQRLKTEIRARLFEAWRDEPARIAARLLAEVEPDDRTRAARERVTGIEKQLSKIDGTVRERLAAKTGAGGTALVIRPMARWSFEGDARDSVAALHGELNGGAKIENGRLVLDGKDAHFVSVPLARDLGEKTIEAWLSLATLEQRGGGVVTVENGKGSVFDSIVFAEKERQHWLAGSNNFQRTQSAGGPPEKANPEEIVHVAITYRADGTITLFRNGAPYGQPWKPSTASPILFAAGDAHILLGKRHSGGSSGFLAGEIEEARLFDRALDPAELAASFRAGPAADAISAEIIANALTPDEQTRRKSLMRELAAARAAPAAAEEKEWRSIRADADKNAANPLHLWAALSKLSGDGMAKAWTGLATAERERPSRAAADIRRRWTLAGDTGDYASCFHYGTGLDSKPGAAGDFAPLPEGNRLLAGLLPAGVATNRLSTKHAGVVTTRRFRVETDSISVKAWGGGGAQARLIVDGYPLGTNPIFPRAQLKGDEPAWLRLDTKYRKGSWAYLEFATAEDQTRREKNAVERSWFGLSEIICHDGDLRREAETSLGALMNGPAPHSAKELAQRYADGIAAALAAWRDGSLDEPQRLLLDFLIRRDVLPVTLPRLPAVAPLVAEYRRMEAEIPVPRRVPGVFEAENVDAAFLPRGDHLKPGDPVPHGFLGVFGDQPFHAQQSGRLDLARAITDPRNPLTARVMANRIWLHVFGRGIVATPDNFGRMGGQPSHPELLDFLAARLAEDGWSLKKTLRFLVTARAFSLGSEASPAARERDAGNELVSHFPVRRLEAETLRDSLLAISGRLDASMAGPGSPAVSNAEKQRRSVYLTIRRNSLSPFLQVFDAPKPFTTVGRRDVTNVPAQSLALLNDPFVIECASKWAGRLIAGNADADPEARIRRMFVEAFARPPAASEMEASLRYLRLSANAPEQPLLSSQPAWRDLAQSLFNLKEFIFLR